MAAVSAASGGLDGGDGNPELTSGIPLCPCLTTLVSLLFLVLPLNFDQGRVYIILDFHLANAATKKLPESVSRDIEKLTVSAGSGVVKSLQKGSACIDNVATGEDIGTSCQNLAITITTTTTTVIFWRHFVLLPRLLLGLIRGME